MQLMLSQRHRWGNTQHSMYSITRGVTAGQCWLSTDKKGQ